MRFYLRFVVDQRIPGYSRQVGLFAAAYYLLDEGDMYQYDRELLDRMLKWFSKNLPIPPGEQIPARAIFWYKEESLVFRRMWYLGKMLKRYHYSISLIKSGFPGNVVYQDEHQVAAVPRKRNKR